MDIRPDSSSEHAQRYRLFSVGKVWSPTGDYQLVVRFAGCALAEVSTARLICRISRFDGTGRGRAERPAKSFQCACSCPEVSSDILPGFRPCRSELPSCASGPPLLNGFERFGVRLARIADAPVVVELRGFPSETLVIPMTSVNGASLHGFLSLFCFLHMLFPDCALSIDAAM